MDKQRTGLWVVLAMINAISTVTGSAVASSGNKLGTSYSTTSVNIRLHIPHRVQIAELTDISLDWPTLNKQHTKALSSNVCIITGTPAFQVTVAKSNSTYPAFKLSNGINELDYSASWIDHHGYKSQFTEAERSAHSRVKIAKSQPCVHQGRAGHLASLTVNFPQIPGKNDSSAIYVGALTLMVSPE